MEPSKLPKKDFASATDAEREAAFKNAKPFRVVRPDEKAQSGSAPRKRYPPFPTDSYADITPASWEWAIDQVLPLGEVTNVEGYSSAGKSSAIVSWAALLSRGLDLPGGQALGEPTGTIYFTTEESARKTVVRRLLAMNADRRFIRNVNLRKLAEERRNESFEEIPSFTFPSGADRLSDTIGDLTRAMGVPVRLGVIDGVLSTMDGGLEMNDPQHVRAYMDSLKLVAEEHNIALLLVRHPSKSRGGPAQQRGAGASAWGDFVRCSWLVGVEPGTRHDEWRRAFVNLKPNAPIRKGLYFKTHWNQEFHDVEVEWGEPCDLTADELYAAVEQRVEAPAVKATEAGVALVLKELHGTDPYAVTSRQVKNRMAGSGVTEQDIWAALQQMKESRKSGAAQDTAALRAGEKPENKELF